MKTSYGDNSNYIKFKIANYILYTTKTGLNFGQISIFFI